MKLALVFCLFQALALAQFSPGPLSKAHTKLDGPSHCTSCHIGGGGQRKLKCTNCHTEIGQRLAANRGLHPSLMGQGRRDDQCGKCHSEHNGENFVPIRWDVSPDEFDHRKTGYPLEGNHTGLKCDRCHNPQRIPPAARKTILMKDLRRSYLGLGTACVTCHEDKHNAQVGDKCDRCHTATNTAAKWKDVTRFDHSMAKYKLTGAHAKVDCAKCHAVLPSPGAASAAKALRYTGIPFARCADCHKDPHRGAFASGCNSCHNEFAWKPARNTVSTFDHSKTSFPLLGKHSPVACDKCHKTADFKAPVAHLQCNACHRDIHGGQFAARAAAGVSADCAACHTSNGWTPSTYTVESHAKSLYPLLGKHAIVTCDKCHIPARAATVYKVRHQECLDCHRDPHAGQFADEAHRNRCDSCHTVDRFVPAKFTLSRHNQTRFPLEGGHLAVACVDCHRKQPDLQNAAAYKFADLTCTGCHLDPHQPKVRGMDARLASSVPAKAPCETCHSTATWRQLSAFDHSKTRFALTGAHRGAACDQCHRSTALSGTHNVVFQGAPLVCASCHEDVHAGQFAALAGNSGCETCHDNINWKAGKFDHQRTAFSLEGAHERVPCKDCHSVRKELDGRTVVLYKPTPKDCASCHGPNLKH